MYNCVLKHRSGNDIECKLVKHENKFYFFDNNCNCLGLFIDKYNLLDIINNFDSFIDEFVWVKQIGNNIFVNNKEYKFTITFG